MDFQHYLNCLKNEKNFSPTTVRAYANDLAIFDRFMATRGKLTIAEVDRPFITAFIQSLKQSDAGRLSSDGLSDATIARGLAVVSSFMDFVRATTLPDLRNRSRKCVASGAAIGVARQWTRPSGRAVDRHHRIA